MATSTYKIGFVIDDSLDKTDGVQQYVLALGAWLTSQHHEVRYLTSTTVRQDIPDIYSLSRNVPVRFNGNRLSIPLPASRARLRAVLEAERFDILHVQMPYSPFLASMIIRRASSPTAIVGTFHILPLDWAVRLANRILGLWLRRSLRRFDKILSVSGAAQQFARQSYGIESQVLPNVIDYDRFANAQVLLPASKLRIVFLGRLVPRKGCLVLLQAIAKLTSGGSDLPDFEVIICGRGPLEARLKDYVQNHHLEAIVSFAGFVSETDKPGYLKSADVAVFPSRGGESFGIVLIEAMAAGAAVLAGDNPGYRSVMADRPEQLFEPKSTVALSLKLEALLKDTDMRRKAQKWGMQYAKSFDTATVGAKLITAYTDALRKRRS